jgi:hypothetical protein
MLLACNPHIMVRNPAGGSNKPQKPGCKNIKPRFQTQFVEIRVLYLAQAAFIPSSTTDFGGKTGTLGNRKAEQTNPANAGGRNLQEAAATLSEP